MNTLALKSRKVKNYIFPLLILSAIFLMVINPSLSMKSFAKGITIWAKNVLPSLLPFFILTRLLTYTKIIDHIGHALTPITQKLYGVGGVSGYVYIMSILSGYPVGAKITSDLYTSGKITRKQAYTITSFSSTSGPLFILGTIGIGIYHSTRIGLIILISHFIGAILNGLLFKNKDNDIVYDNKPITNVNSINISDIMYDSIKSILIIGGFISMSYMLIELLIQYRMFLPIEWIISRLGIDTEITTGIISGIIEITTGSIMLSTASLTHIPLIMILTFLVSFGGLSIHAQAYIFLSNFNMPYKNFLLQKICHATISTCISPLLCLI